MTTEQFAVILSYRKESDGFICRHRGVVSMEEYMKPKMELIALSDDVILTSGCSYECGCTGVGTIELPCMPGDW